jgi:hypothetical protein
VREPWIEIDPDPEKEGERGDLQRQPDRLGPFLEGADAGEAVGDERDDDQRIEQIADAERQAKEELECLAKDRCLEREEDEGEAGVDQRGDGGTEIAEAGAPGQQVDIHAGARRVIGDRQPGQEHQRADRQDRDHGVVEAIGEGKSGADRLERQERDGADRGIGHPTIGPFSRSPRREAQREILHRLVRDPLIVGTAKATDAACALDHPWFLSPAAERSNREARMTQRIAHRTK